MNASAKSELLGEFDKTDHHVFVWRNEGGGGGLLHMYHLSLLLLLLPLLLSLLSLVGWILNSGCDESGCFKQVPINASIACPSDSNQ